MSESQSGVLKVSWRAVSIGTAIVALGAIVVASVVSSVRDADALSVIALALAIIAFVIQIITFILQTYAAAQQEQRAEQIFGETRATLRAIEEKMEGTRQAMSSLNGTLLEAALGKAIPEARASSDSSSPAEISRMIADRVTDIMESSESQKRSRTGNEPPAPTASSLRRAPTSRSPLKQRRPSTRNVEMTAPMTEHEQDEAGKLIGKLDPQSQRALRWLAEDELTYAGSVGVGPGVSGISKNVAEKLYSHGLIVRKRATWTSSPVFQLTPLGKSIARFFVVPKETLSNKELIDALEVAEAWDRHVAGLLSKEEDFSSIPVQE